MPGVWGLIGGGVVASLAEAVGMEESLSQGIGMLAVIAISEGINRRIRDGAERDALSGRGSDPDRYEEPESAQHWRQ